MGRKVYMTFEIDEDRLKHVLKGRKNPVATAKWMHVQCKFCNSYNVFRYGFDRKGNQRFICNECKRTFMDNKAPERMRYPTEVIASSINLFYEGLSLHKIQRQLKLDYGIMPDHHSIYDWITRYTKKAVKSLNNVKPKVGNTWASDETVLKLKSEGGRNIWLFDCIDEGSRFMLASHLTPNRYASDAKTLMMKAEHRAGKPPKVMLTDKLKAYLSAIEDAWGADTKHKQSSPFHVGQSTRSIERLHGTIKDRTKIMRGLANKETAKLVMEGWGIHYNFFRPHTGLNGKTPSEVARADSPYKSWADVVKEK
jgi:transposase-like protein